MFSATEELHDVHAILKAVVDTVHDAIVVIDEAGSIVGVNPALEGILGHGAEELVGQRVETLLAEPDRSRHAGYLAKYLATREGRIIGAGREVEALHKDGSRVWVELAVSPFVVGAKQFFCGTLRDISAQKRAEDERVTAMRQLELGNARLNALVRERTSELERSDQFLRCTLDALNINIAILDASWTIIAVNQAWRVFGEENGGSSYLGESYGAVLDRAAAEGVEDAVRLSEGLRRVQRGEIAELLHEYPCHSPDKKRWFAMRATRFVGERGDVHLVVAHADITARRAAEERLRHVQKLEAVGLLAGGIAHDFNNIVTAIRYHAAFLGEVLPAGSVGIEELAQIETAAERAADLTRQLLTFGRRQAVDPQILEINPLVEEILPMLRRLVGGRIEIQVSLDPEAGCVEIERSQFHQVITNLVLNARDAIRDTGRIVVRTVAERDREARRAVLQVEDTGVGMTEEIRQRLFEPFYTTKGLGQGTGLGLSIVYGIVTQAGGTIAVRSTVGSGALFTIVLPSLPCPTPAHEARPSEPPGDLASTSILLVEDDEVLRKAASRALRAEGRQVRDVASPQDALAVVVDPKVRIDLVISDVLMPDMTGAELAREIRRLRPDVPILLITGYAGRALEERDLAAFPVLHKPFTPKQLEAAVRAILERTAT